MEAILRLGTTQVKVSEGSRIKVERLAADKGEAVTIEDVLAVIGGGETVFGRPRVDGAKVEAKVIRHGRDAKIKVFKYKAKKRYRVTNGHRQEFTEIEIGRIIGPGAGEAAAPEQAAEVAGDGA